MRALYKAGIVHAKKKWAFCKDIGDCGMQRGAELRGAEHDNQACCPRAETGEASEEPAFTSAVSSI